MPVDPAAALAALRRADLDWTTNLSDVWAEAPADVPGLHAGVRAELLDAVEDLALRRDARSPLGRLVVGRGGSGKTHLLGAVRRACAASGAAFVLVDMTDVREFWPTVLQGFLVSLEQVGPDGRPQHRVLLDAVVARADPAAPAARALAAVGSRKSADLAGDVRGLLDALHREHPRETRRYQETLRALVYLNSEDREVSYLAYAALQGEPVDPELGAALEVGGVRARRDPAGGPATGPAGGGPPPVRPGPRSHPREIVRALSWVMSLAGPAVVAFDQLDPIVQRVRWSGGSAAGGPDGDTRDDAERTRARAILEEIGGGLGAMRDTVSRTLTVVACVEATEDLLREVVFGPNMDRFAAPLVLVRADAPDLHRALVAGRLAPAFAAAGVDPPHPTWPFAAAAFADLSGVTPRQVLKYCDAHRIACRRAGAVSELTAFGPAGAGDSRKAAPDSPRESATPGPPPTDSPAGVPAADPAGGFAALDRRFAELRAEADPVFLLEDKREDERQAPPLRSALKCLVRERAADLPDDVDAAVEDHFPGGATTVPLHARLRLTFLARGEQEEHHAVRALPRAHATAYQNRLRAAVRAAGIDRDLGFRHLVIVRVPPPPTGRVSAELTDRIRAAGGRFFAPSDEQVRTLHALHRLLTEADPDLDDWLRARRPATAAGLAESLAPGSLFTDPPPGPPPSPEADPAPDPPPKPAPIPPAAADRAESGRDDSDLPFGRRVVAGKADGPPATVPVEALRKHVLVIGGAGSGKTVTLRRLVEEAALRGIPSVVVDHAGDLGCFDEDWPDPPAGWGAEDAGHAARFRAAAEQVVFTPGSVGGGNPLVLRPLPDFTPLTDDPGALADAVNMAAGGLADVVARGSGRSASAKEGLLAASLTYFAKTLPDGGLDRYIDLLDALPADAGTGVTDEAKFAGQMADDLKSERAKNPLLAAAGTPLDPAVLFGDDRDRDAVRISVLSLAKLTGAARPAFLNQLATELFPWLRRHPAPPGGRPLRGLLVIDEARDFLPSGSSTACKGSLMRLAAQGRKYGLGLVLATQHPTEIDNRAAGNCSTQLFGRANSPRAQQVVRDYLRQAGGDGRDIGTLPVGRFYLACPDAGLKPPVLVQVPQSLSRSPANPPGEAEVMAKAERDRERLEDG